MTNRVKEKSELAEKLMAVSPYRFAYKTTVFNSNLIKRFKNFPALK